MLRVACKQSTCNFYSALPGPEAATHCDCSHPQKPYYVGAHPCPLYRLKWSGKDEQMERAKALIRSKRA